MFDFNSGEFKRENLDLAAYEAKFKKIDEIKEKLKNSTNQKELERLTKELGMSLKDPTLYAYFFFRINNEPLRLFAYQDAFLNDTHRFKYFRSANQTGKSSTFVVKAAMNLLRDHGKSHVTAIVSKSLPQSTYQIREVKKILKTAKIMNWKEESHDAENLSVITCDMKEEGTKSFPEGRTKYTNMLICAPATEGLLGYPINDLYLDEFEYWEIDLEYFYNQIALPRTFATKGNISILTNPNGSENYGATLEAMRDPKTGIRKFHCYVFDYLDRPGNTKEEYEELERTMPRQKFESTVAAIRSISSRNYFTTDEIKRSFDPDLTELKMVGKQPFFFLDVGAKHDQSVLVGGFVEPDPSEKFVHLFIPIIHVYPVGYPLSRVVGIPVDSSDGWHHEKSVKETLSEWGSNGINPTFGYDATGNSGIGPLLEAAGIFGQDVTFSGPVKSGMYQRYKYYMEKGLVHRVKSEEWEKQASKLIVKKSIRGYLMVHHETEDDLDDTQDAMAGLIFLTDNPIIIPSSLRLIK